MRKYLWLIPGLITLVMVHLAFSETGDPLRTLWAIPDESFLRTTGIFNSLFLGQDSWLVLAHLLVVGLALLSWQTKLEGEKLALAVSRWRHVVALGALLGMAAGAVWIYRAHPLSMDEYAPYLQAQIFAQGDLAWHVEPSLLDRIAVPKFQQYFLAADAQTGRIASMYWPGLALLMTPFAWLGVPWLLNPLLTAGSLLLIHALGRRMGGGRAATGGWAMLLALASPVIWINGMGFYSMPAHLAANLMFVWLITSPQLRAWHLLLAGAVGALALNLHNPLPHILFALPWWIWLFWRKGGWRHVAWLALGYGPLGLGMALGWASFIAGFVPAVKVASEAATAAGTLADQSLFIRILQKVPFQWPTATVLTYRFISLIKLWLWAIPGLLLWAGAGLSHWHTKVEVRLWAWSAALTFVFYLFIGFDQGHGWGYRYMHPAWAAFPLIAAVWLSTQPASKTAEGPQSQLTFWQIYTGKIAYLSMLLILPLQMILVQQFMDWHLSQRPSAPNGSQEHIIFVKSNGYIYFGDLVQNSPSQPQRLVLLSRGDREDESFMHASRPGWVRIERDMRGSVWAPAPKAKP
ncbi:hypothetical protein [Ideonella sp.]|uniref:hypothetical protein n=1 Tax=Ideonella sp. TaxID=1929293 RepID=UPI003BB6E2FE